jgi:hypothetical protein
METLNVNTYLAQSYYETSTVSTFLQEYWCENSHCQHITRELA